MKKLARVVLLAAAALGNAVSSEADSTVAVQHFQKDFDNKYTEVYAPSTLSSGTQAKTSIMYPDYLKTMLDANMATTESLSSTFALRATSQNLINSLTEFSYKLLKPTSSEASLQSLSLEGGFFAEEQTNPGQFSPIPFAKYNSQNELSNLINGPTSVGSDTLYSTELQTNSAMSSGDLPQDAKKLVKQPNAVDVKNNNNNFNFAAIIEPTVYKNVPSNNGGAPTNPQWTAAKNYVIYAAQSTKNLSDGLNLNSIQNNPGDVAKLKTNPDYLKFAMTIRTILAIRSITIDTLEYLIAERTPHPNLGIAIKDPNKDKSASPLQVEEYQANQRIKDKNWYASIMNDAPVTVQRTIAIELAEIEHQNYQAHLDRERILAALTAANLQTNLAGSTSLTQQIDTLNTDINNMLPKPKALKSNNPPPQNNKPAIQAPPGA